MNDIKVILFDLGNVLIDVDYAIAAKRIAYFCGKEPEEIIQTLSKSDITNGFEQGSFTPEAFFSSVKGLLGLNISYKRFVPIWNEVFFLSVKNRCVHSLAYSLKSKYRIALLSNINMLHFEYINKHFPLFGIFDRIFLSYKMGMVKPDPNIYYQTLKELSVEPREVFYTDDREELIKSSRSVGIRGFRFTGYNQLKSDLMNEGVI